MKFLSALPQKAVAAVLFMACVLCPASPEKTSFPVLLRAFLAHDSSMETARRTLALDLAEAGLSKTLAGAPAFAVQGGPATGGLSIADPAGILTASSLAADLSMSLSLDAPPAGLEVAPAIARQRYSATAQERIHSFLVACIDLVEARRRVALLHSSADTISQSLDAALARQKAGAGTDLEVIALRRSLAMANAELGSGSADLSRADEVAAELLGSSLPGDIDLGDIRGFLLDATQSARVAAADLAVLQAKADETAAQRPFSLGLSLSGHVGFLPFATPMALSASAAATLSLGLAPGTGRAAQARERLGLAKREAQDALAEIRLSLSLAERSWKAAESKVGLYGDAVDQARQYLASISQAYRVGAVTVRDVLAAQGDLQSSQLAALGAESAAARSWAEMASIVGIDSGGGP